MTTINKEKPVTLEYTVITPEYFQRIYSQVRASISSLTPEQIQAIRDFKSIDSK